MRRPPSRSALFPSIPALAGWALYSDRSSLPRLEAQGSEFSGAIYWPGSRDQWHDAFRRYKHGCRRAQSLLKKHSELEGYDPRRGVQENVSDCRASPTLDVMRMLMNKGAHVSYNDPFVPVLGVNGNTLRSVELTPVIVGGQDCIVIITEHADYDCRKIVAAAKLVVDTRNVTKDLVEFKNRIIKLGAGNKTALAHQHEDQHEKKVIGLAAH